MNFSPKILIGTNALSFETLFEIVSSLTDQDNIALDTSPNYLTERNIGTAISKLIHGETINRDIFFIQTKLEFIDQKKGRIERAFHDSLSNLGLEYIDSYLMHWPNPDTFTRDWKVFEKLYKEGLVRNIGVCNFRLRHWKQLLDSDIEVLPHINQIEIHPLRTCVELLDYCQNLEIHTQAYSPICKMIPPIRDNELLNHLSAKYCTSVPELILAWHISRNVSPITKSSKPQRVKSNIVNALSLSLDPSDIALISSLNQNYKYYLESWGCPGF